MFVRLNAPMVAVLMAGLIFAGLSKAAAQLPPGQGSAAQSTPLPARQPGILPEMSCKEDGNRDLPQYLIDMFCPGFGLISRFKTVEQINRDFEAIAKRAEIEGCSTAKADRQVALLEERKIIAAGIQARFKILDEQFRETQQVLQERYDRNKISENSNLRVSNPERAALYSDQNDKIRLLMIQNKTVVSTKVQELQNEQDVKVGSVDRDLRLVMAVKCQ